MPSVWSKLCSVVSVPFGVTLKIVPLAVSATETGCSGYVSVGLAKGRARGANGLADIDRVASERLGRARVAGNAQPAAFNRQVAMLLAKRVGSWSLTKIGKFSNGGRHTTVRHAIRQIEPFRGVNPDVDRLLAGLIDQIKDVGGNMPSWCGFRSKWGTDSI